MGRFSQRGIGGTGARPRSPGGGRLPASAVRAALGLAMLGLWAAPARANDAAGIRPSAGLLPLAATAARLAAQEGLSYTDQGSFVLLYDGQVRLRLYPGTHSAIVDGDEFELKDRLRRDAGEVVLSERVARFLTGRIRATRQAAEGVRLERERADQERQRAAEEESLRVAERERAREALRAERRKREQQRPPTPAAAPRSAAAAAPGWVPVVAERPWRWIVLHHSDDTTGCLHKYHDIHLNERRWEHGCGYHFVIGNGTQTRDGEVEISKRWHQQLQGAHAKTPDNRYNEHGVGIVLVGDFEAGGRPTARQMDSLAALCRWLMGRYGIGVDAVVGHCDVGRTCCPGRNFPWAELRQRLAR